uniref:Phosphatidylinositol transfer protein cytoplasmic 1b n=1 Tax=Hucho hucho TaxID=62062 RepID=A0A4W5PPR1_9TELE
MCTIYMNWKKDIGQLYMISKHRNEQSGGGEGVEVVRNQPDTHPQHGLGQLTEKRIYLNSKLPSWVSVFVPRVFYVTEKAWNFYPYTITGLTTLFYPPNTHIRIETRFENNNGDNSNVFGDRPTPAESVSHLDILIDPIPDKHYKETEVLACTHTFLPPDFRCSSNFRNKGQSARHIAETHTHYLTHLYNLCINIQDILLVGHRQAVAWTDEWHGQ